MQTPVLSALIQRRLSALLAVVALLMQLLLPAVAQAGSGNWVEICADGGPVLVQLDLEGPGDPATTCADCAFCAFAAPGLPVLAALPGRAPAAARAVALTQPVQSAVQQRYQRPETRGPPKISTKIIGGASWI